MTGWPQFAVPFSAVIHAALALAFAQSQALHPAGNGTQAAESPPFLARMQYCFVASQALFTAPSAPGHETVVAGRPPVLDEEAVPLEELLEDAVPLEELLLVAHAVPACELPALLHS